MATSTVDNGATQGALIVLLGMILGAMLLLVVQRYVVVEKRKDLSKLYKVYENEGKT